MLPTIGQNRALLAHHLTGRGVEFGALDGPLVTPPGVVVRYADHITAEQARATYGADVKAVEVDILLNTNSRLDEIADGEEDFIIANQVIEHLPNPIGAMRVWARKLKPGGVLYLAFPMGPLTPDKDRPTTKLEHLLADDRRNTTDASDEHLMAFIDGWNPHYFPDRQNIADLLARMRAEDREFLTPEEIAASPNRHLLETLDRTQEIHQHVFEMDLLVGAAKAADPDLHPFDCSLGRGLFNEQICLFRKGGDAGQAQRSFAAAMEREAMLDALVFGKDDYIRGLLAHLSAPPPPLPRRIVRAVRRIGRKLLRRPAQP